MKWNEERSDPSVTLIWHTVGQLNASIQNVHSILDESEREGKTGRCQLRWKRILSVSRWKCGKASQREFCSKNRLDGRDGARHALSIQSDIKIQIEKRSWICSKHRPAQNTLISEWNSPTLYWNEACEPAVLILASACESEGVQACQRKPSSTGRSIPGRLLSVHWLRFTGCTGAPYLDAPDIETSPGGAATSVATRWNKSCYSLTNTKTTWEKSQSVLFKLVSKATFLTFI